MKPINQFTSKIVTKGEREVLKIHGENSTLVEREGVYSIKTIAKIGQAKVASYRGIDEKYDDERVLEAVWNGI